MIRNAVALAAVGVLLFMVIGQSVLPPAYAGDEKCDANVSAENADLTCVYGTDEARDTYHRKSTTTKHRLRRVCTYGSATLCSAPFAYCGDQEKDTYVLEKSPIDEESWTEVAFVCLGDETEVTTALSATEVAREFARLVWPEAILVIQPPGGETLVNLPTIFYTPDAGPASQTVTLLGIDVEIEATPVSWTWHWARGGDDATSNDLTASTTDHPGAPHPNETITHAYARAGTVRPSVDVTYSGRFRVGEGEWVDIAENHAVPGDPEQLTVLEARPVLIP